MYLTAAALRLARFNIQVNTDKRYFIGLPSPAAAGLVAATVFYFPEGLQAKPIAWLGMVMLIVPALLMVSTIRFQSFKTFDLGMRRGWRGLFLVAAFIALLVSYPHEVLIAMAYAYFASGFIGELMAQPQGRARHGRARRAPHRAKDASLGCGSVIVTLVPRPFSDVTAIVPRFASTLRFAIVNPRPVPIAFVEKYGSKILAIAWSSMPMPVSVTRSCTM